MCRTKINKIKIKILKAAYAGGEGHIGSAFSVADILYVLYNSSVKISSELI